MISYAQSVLDEGGQFREDAGGGRESAYAGILRTLQALPLGQEDDSRDLAGTAYLGEN